MMFEKAPNGLCLVEFKKSWRQYNNGTVAGFVEEDAKKLCKGGFAKPHRSSSSSDQSSSQSEPVDPSTVEIPEDFQGLHHNKIIAIAQKFDPSVKTKDTAIVAILDELERRADEADAGTDGDDGEPGDPSGDEDGVGENDTEANETEAGDGSGENTVGDGENKE